MTCPRLYLTSLPCMQRPIRAAQGLSQATPSSLSISETRGSCPARSLLTVVHVHRAVAMVVTCSESYV